MLSLPLKKLFAVIKVFEMKKEFKIGKTKVGGDNPCFIVAEIGINFDGKYDQALALIDAAGQAGCNAVKFQLFKAARMYPQGAGKYKTASGKVKNIINIVKDGELPYRWVPKLRNYTKQKGLEFFSSVCDEISADVLEKYQGDAFKITSYEITHLPLIRHVAKKKKPVIFSSGGATLTEVSEAMNVFREENNDQIVLLHCVSRYPAPLDNLNLNIIKTLQTIFPKAIIGYSDHSSDPVAAPRAAVALGAKVIEKHITLDRKLPGPDHFFAVEPEELALMVKTIRRTEKEVKQGKKIEFDPVLSGKAEKKIYGGERRVRNFAYSCIFAKKKINRGEKFTKNNLIILRPGEKTRGLKPKYYELLINRYRAARAIPKYKSVSWNDVSRK
jgi:sialic acid synthase SpsE